MDCFDLTTLALFASCCIFPHSSPWHLLSDCPPYTTLSSYLHCKYAHPSTSSNSVKLSAWKSRIKFNIGSESPVPLYCQQDICRLDLYDQGHTNTFPVLLSFTEGESHLWSLALCVLRISVVDDSHLCIWLLTSMKLHVKSSVVCAITDDFLFEVVLSTANHSPFILLQTVICLSTVRLEWSIGQMKPTPII